MTFSFTGRLFTGTSTEEFISRKHLEISQRIHSLNDNEILNLGIEQYSEQLLSYYIVDFPLIDTESCSISDREADIPASQFPSDFSFFDRNKLFRKQIISFHLKYIGDLTYLNYSPSTISFSIIPTPTILLDEITFDYINFYNNTEQIKNQFKNDLESFSLAVYRLKIDFDNYNQTLKDFIKSEIQNRKEHVLRNKNFLASFEIPLKQRKETPTTFSIPTPKLRERISLQPRKASNEPFVPEPTLDYNNYIKILKLIDDVGKNFERLPAITKDKNEEALRDHILMVLDPNFENGSATGETFNMSGKTDILLRYDSSVVFIAECKFWHGEKGFLETIDQLLGYLTWRDSKTALVIFVRNKEIIEVIQKIHTTIKSHPNYISKKNDYAENWVEFIFCLPADQNKEIIVSVLAFHLLPNK